MHLDPFERTVIHPVVQGLPPKDHLFFRIENQEVCIAPDGHRTLFREQPEKHGGICTRERGHLMNGNSPLSHTLRIQKGDDRFRTREPVRDQEEVFPSQLFLALEVERRMIRPHNRENTAAKTDP